MDLALPPADDASIAADEWERVPSSVKQLVETLSQRLAQQEQKLGELRAEIERRREQQASNSRNSSKPRIRATEHPPSSEQSRERKETRWATRASGMQSSVIPRGAVPERHRQLSMVRR